jgi:hypothetical protein
MDQFRLLTKSRSHVWFGNEINGFRLLADLSPSAGASERPRRGRERRIFPCPRRGARRSERDRSEIGAGNCATPQVPQSAEPHTASLEVQGRGRANRWEPPDRTRAVPVPGPRAATGQPRRVNRAAPDKLCGNLENGRNPGRDSLDISGGSGAPKWGFSTARGSSRAATGTEVRGMCESRNRASRISGHRQENQRVSGPPVPSKGRKSTADRGPGPPDRRATGRTGTGRAGPGPPGT